MEDWEDWTTNFKVDTLANYTYVRIKGTVYLNKYAASSVADKVALYRPHMNAKVSDLASIKPDGTRAVGFRENVLTANIGDAWTNYFTTAWSTSTSSSASKSQTVDIIAVFTGSNSINFQLTILEASWLA